jgi:hypothetical protein
MSFRPISVAAAVIAAGVAWLATPQAFAMNVKQLNVADMVKQSDQIVAGTVTAVEQGFDQRGLPYTEVQLKVAESIRGSASGTMTFRQFGLQKEMPAFDGRKFVGLVAGMPRYTQGEQVVLFLTRPSTIGFRTTIGLEQGRFTRRGGNFENGANNAGLFRDVDLSKVSLNTKEKFLVATQEGAVNAETFLGLVRRSVRERWWTAPVIKPVKPGAKIVGTVNGGAR